MLARLVYARLVIVRAAESKKVHVELLSRERKFRAAVEAGLREKVEASLRGVHAFGCGTVCAFYSYLILILFSNVAII